MSTILKELRENLELLPIGELRKKAVTNFGIRLNKDFTKEDIINAIVGVASKADYAPVATDARPAPGWTRIKCHPLPGRSSFPFFVGINGYFCFVPYSVDVDVPSKLVGVLRDAKEMRLATDEMGNQVRRMEDSYPFSILDETPGPDPRPGMEVARERKLKSKREFADREGYWPKNKDINDAKQAAMLKNAFSGN